MEELTSWAFVAVVVAVLLLRFRREAEQLERLQHRARVERNRFERGFR